MLCFTKSTDSGPNISDLPIEGDYCTVWPRFFGTKSSYALGKNEASHLALQTQIFPASLLLSWFFASQMIESTKELSNVLFILAVKEQGVCFPQF